MPCLSHNSFADEITGHDEIKISVVVACRRTDKFRGDFAVARIRLPEDTYYTPSTDN